MSKIITFLLFSVLLNPFVAFSQTTNGSDVVVEISKEKVLINSKSFFRHKVKKGENLYRISRAYNVSQKDIIIANPETISGNIKEGQVLNIPAETSAKSASLIESDNFIYHIAEEKQTVFSIAQKYKVTQDDIFKFNPELQNSPLQIGQVVKVPKASNIPNDTDRFKPVEKYEDYKVGRRETMYSIASEHNITVNELIAANPILKNSDLQKGQIIQIPVKSEKEIVSAPSVAQTDTSRHATKEITPCNDYKPFSETISVALLLPISLEGNEGVVLIDSIGTSTEGHETYATTINLLEFYQGTLLALDSLKRAGMSVKLYTFDTGRDNQKIAGILAKPEMAKMDLIIGPLTYNTETIEKTAQFAAKNQIKMVSPVSTNIRVVKDNPNVFQINANESFDIEVMLKYIASTYQKRNIILVNSGKESDRDTFLLFKNRLSVSFPDQFKVFGYNDDPKQIDHLFQKEADNLIIIPSENEAVISRLLNHLNYNLSQNYSVKVFGLSSWAVFKGLDQGLLYNLEFQYTSTFFVNFKAPEIQNFFSKYKHYYKTLPSYHTKDGMPQFLTKDGYNMAFLGYDIAFYFLNSMGRLGKNFENCLSQQKTDLLHTNLSFERISAQGGFVNKGVNILKYAKDYNIVKAN